MMKTEAMAFRYSSSLCALVFCLTLKFLHLAPARSVETQAYFQEYAESDRSLYELECTPVYTNYGKRLDDLPSTAGSSPGFLSDVALGLVENYRMASQSYYQDQMETLEIAYCERRPSAAERWTRNSHPEAAKDYYGNCVVTDTVPEDADCGIRARANASSAAAAATSSLAAANATAGNTTATSSSSEEEDEEEGAYCCERAANCYWRAPEPGEPRQRAYTDSEGAAAGSFLFDYVRGLAVPAAPGFLLACIVFVAAPLYGIVHHCYWCLCCRLRLEGYTEFEKWFPFGVFWFFVICACLAFTWALFAHLGINASVERVYEYLGYGVEDLQAFVPAVVAPLMEVAAAVPPQAQALNFTVSQAQYAYAAHADVYAVLKAFRDRNAAWALNASAGQADLVAQVNTTLEAVRSGLSPIVDDTLALAEVLWARLVVPAPEVAAAAAGAARALAALNGSAARWEHEASVVQDAVDSLAFLQQWGLMGIVTMSLSFTLVTATLMSIGSTQCDGHKQVLNATNCTWAVNWALTVAGLASAAALTVALILGHDGCVYLERALEDPSAYLGAAAGAPLGACLHPNGTLEAALNLTRRFDVVAVGTDAYRQAKNYVAADQWAPTLLRLKQLTARLDSMIDFEEEYTWLSVLTYARGNYSFRGPEDRAIGTGCVFNETYLTEEEVLYPWRANRGRGDQDANFLGEGYRRAANESGPGYMARLYAAPGICPDLSSEILSLYDAAYNNTAEKCRVIGELDYPAGAPASVCWEWLGEGGGGAGGGDAAAGPWPYPFTVGGLVDELRSNFTATAAALLRAHADTDRLVYAPAATFQCLQDCYWLEDYRSWLQGELCESILGGLGQLGICLYVLMFFNIPLMIITCMQTRRLRRPKFERQVLPTVEDQYQIFTKKIPYKKYVRKRRE